MLARWALGVCLALFISPHVVKKEVVVWAFVAFTAILPFAITEHDGKRTTK